MKIILKLLLQKVFKAAIDTRHLDPNKEELFFKPFSIYSNVDYKTLKEKLIEGKKNLKFNLTYNIDSRSKKKTKRTCF